jgi:hypothetical protein
MSPTPSAAVDAIAVCCAAWFPRPTASASQLVPGDLQPDQHRRRDPEQDAGEPFGAFSELLAKLAADPQAGLGGRGRPGQNATRSEVPVEQAEPQPDAELVEADAQVDDRQTLAVVSHDALPDADKSSRCVLPAYNAAPPSPPRRRQRAPGVAAQRVAATPSTSPKGRMLGTVLSSC